MVLHNVVDDGLELGLLGLVDHVGAVLPNHGPVGGDLHHVQLVDFRELLLLGHGGTRHAGELVVQAEVVLEGDGGKRPAFPGHLHALLGLNGLVQALVVAAAVHQAAGELIHNDDLAVLHHIVLVPVHDAPGLDGLVHMVLDLQVVWVGQVLDAEKLLGLFHAPAGEGTGLPLLIDDVVVILIELVVVLFLIGLLDADRLQRPGKGVGPAVEVIGLGALTRDDEGGAGLVDEDGVHLVHNGVIVAPLHLALLVGDHVVPQVVKAHLVVGAVGDVAGVSRLLLLGGHAVEGQAHGHPHKVEHPGHHLALVLGQVLVDRDHMDALPRQGVEISGQGQGEGLALTGLHLGDAALVQDDAALHLHREQPDGEHPGHGLPAGGKGVGEDIVQGLALFQPPLEKAGLGLQLLIAQLLIFVFQAQHLVHQGLDAL